MSIARSEAHLEVSCDCESLKPVISLVNVSISQREKVLLVAALVTLAFICAEKPPSLRNVLIRQYSELDTNAEMKSRLASYALLSK